MDFESVLNRFMEASKKRHDAIDSSVKNHQASIKNIETQLGQLTTLVNERLPPKNPNQRPQELPNFTHHNIKSNHYCISVI